ncbi:hypothetical protein GQX73_g1855 [Xylaria multiplex]|uniref:Uncharacterized protein n=1 Tax=Xylaria multiplex TaxID=323545 RepID=A0A7C8ITA1_9PEZI|nr:hypothetical protein GQX73_g1855 [Xylaria multiplex]
MENLLKLTLSFVSDDQLESALQAPPHSTSICEWKGTADPVTWELYPLISLQDIRAWQASSMPAPADGHQHRNRMLYMHDAIPADGSGPSGEHYTDDALNSAEEDSQSFQGTTRIETDANTGSHPFTPKVSTSMAADQSHLNAGGVQNNCISPNSIPQSMDDTIRHNSPPRFSLPAEFKEEFLW